MHHKIIKSLKASSLFRNIYSFSSLDKNFQVCCYCLIYSNYGPTILAQQHAEMQGLHQVLWLFGEDRQVRN